MKRIDPLSTCLTCKFAKTRVLQTQFLESGNKHNCSICGALVHTSETFVIKPVTKRNCQVSPQILLKNIDEVSQRESVPFCVRKGLQTIRERNIDLIHLQGTALKQSQSTIHLAIRYFDRILIFLVSLLN